MESWLQTVLTLFGLAVVIVVVCLVIDKWGWEWRWPRYETSTIPWYIGAGVLVILAIIISLYHFSGIQIGFK